LQGQFTNYHLNITPIESYVYASDVYFMFIVGKPLTGSRCPGGQSGGFNQLHNSWVSPML
jgi:hypothetical protein